MMPNRKTLEVLRRMSPDERRNAVQELSEHYARSYFKGTPYQVARRFERMRKAKDEANERILEALSRSNQNLDDEESFDPPRHSDI
jgi:hypothetical protein